MQRSGLARSTRLSRSGGAESLLQCTFVTSQTSSQHVLSPTHMMCRQAPASENKASGIHGRTLACVFCKLMSEEVAELVTGNPASASLAAQVTSLACLSLNASEGCNGVTIQSRVCMVLCLKH